MSLIFRNTPNAAGVRITAEHRRLLSKSPVQPKDWPSLEGRHGVAGSVLMGMVQRGDAWVEGEVVILNHCAAARIPSSVADTLSLPPLAPLSLTLSFEGRIEEASSRIRVRWYDANTRSLTITRIGAFVNYGGKTERLSAFLYDLVEKIDGFNATQGAILDSRITAWQPVQNAIQNLTGGQVKSDAYLKNLTIYQAGSFALDVRETTQGIDFKPVLMNRAKAPSLEDNAPIGDGADPGADLNEKRDEVVDALLPPELQERFSEEHFRRHGATRDAYVLGRNTFLVVDPDLKIALDVVRRKRSAPEDERRAFVRNPRPAVIEALGQEDAGDATVSLFVETEQYSARVVGLGLWNPPKVPLKPSAQQWLPEEFPLRLGDKNVLVTGAETGSLRQAVASAKASGQLTVMVKGELYPVDDIETALAVLSSGAQDANEPFTDAGLGPKPDRNVLIIEDNVDKEGFRANQHPRPALSRDFPHKLLAAASTPKTHQRNGFDWLVSAWASGLPGVLLADDMGLGKTFQALAFLAWLRRNKESPGAGQAAPKQGPALIVAPTALLNTWIAEAKNHLAPDVLGERIDVFGTAICRLKRPKTADWTPEDSLDVDMLRKADWILTTYETLADNHRAFARIAYSVAIFDEMQKVKAPGTINTHTAKTINADFVLGLTGTPIENRVEDLWCIMDRITPGELGSLKAFSATYGNGDRQQLINLKKRLDCPQNGAPALMLRRMKEAILDGLPEKEVKTYRVEMPDPQADAYTEAVRAAQSGERTMGTMLKALHAFRGISLHPDGSEDIDCYDPPSVNRWIDRSARLKKAIEVLREVERRGEKALVFVEDRNLQRSFAAASIILFGLRTEPAIVNGEVPGAKRQAIVDAFQVAPPGFGLLILSPRAAGIGLTITAANHVVHLSRWWNPAVEDQCNDRVYRIGQKKPVTIHVPMAMHPDFGDASFDITLDGLLARKRTLSRDMLAPPLAEADVATLFTATVIAE